MAKHNLDEHNHADLCGRVIQSLAGLSAAVDLFIDLDRALWNAAVFDLAKSRSRLKVDTLGEVLQRLMNERGINTGIAGAIISRLYAFFKLEGSSGSDAYSLINPLGARQPDNAKRLSRSLLRRPSSLASCVLDEVATQDIHYFARNNIRREHGLLSAHDIVVPFRQISRALKPLVERRRRLVPTTVHEFYRLIALGLQKADIVEHNATLAFSHLFLECCRNVGYLVPGYGGPGSITLDAGDFDIEFLLSHLYGFPTGIPGFDELFGGGGLLLANRASPQEKPQHGRSILIKGRFGTGKSILALQLCAEVARKGGIARYIALEQPASECVYVLNSFGVLPHSNPVRVITEAGELAGVLKAAKRRGGLTQGVLAITDGIKDSATDFLRSLEFDAESAQLAEVSLLAVDPINSIHRIESPEDSIPQLRSAFLKTLHNIKALGSNVLFVAEENPERANETLFEENIVDTVIHLSEQRIHGYSHRHFEIEKSRLQREHRGPHVYSIVSGDGIHLYPSAAAVDTRIRQRRLILPGQRQTRNIFGLPELDDILGNNALYRGDVIAFRGATGSFKTQLGLNFLLNSDIIKKDEFGDTSVVSLLIAARDSRESLEFHLHSLWVENYLVRMRELEMREHATAKLLRKGGASVIEVDEVLKHRMKSVGDVIICSIPLSDVHPGLVLQRIEEYFDRAIRNSQRIDRVMVTNIAHWELSCQFIRQDKTFADTLVNLMRRRGVTSVFICGDIADMTEFDVQRPILDHADVVVQFEKLDFQGERRITLRATKTRSMSHSKERFEVDFADSHLQVRQSASLLRSSSSGDARIVPIRLFLHSESATQEKYNASWRDAIRSVLSRDVMIETQAPMFSTRAAQLNHLSGLDELLICQVDEYQAPRLESDWEWATPISEIFLFPDGSSPFVGKFCGGLSIPGRGWLAVPYYADVGILVYRDDVVPAIADIGSWEELCEEQDKWCERCRRSSEVSDVLFFDFQQSTSENFNCLFFEVLYSRNSPDADCYDDHVQSLDAAAILRFVNRLGSPSGTAALRLFWRLAHCAYQRKRHARTDGVSEKARSVVSRHWYSTAHQMSERMSSEDVQHLRIREVPGGRGVAGEWLLCIPSHSTAVEIGKEIICHAVSPEAEIERLRLGVGLPVRQSFYEGRNIERVRISKGAECGPLTNDGTCRIGFGKFVVDFRDVGVQLGAGIRRSRLFRYSRWSGSLASGLERILSIPEMDEEWEHVVSGIVDAVCHDIRYSCAE